MHAEPWDIKQHKREKYGLTAQVGERGREGKRRGGKGEAEREGGKKEG